MLLRLSRKVSREWSHPEDPNGHKTRSAAWFETSFSDFAP